MNSSGALSNACVFFRFQAGETPMNEFDHKVEQASARVNRTVSEAADRLEKETAEFVKYLNDEVVPAVRQHSTKVLRAASQKLAQLAEYMEETNPSRK
jgi:F0F1-type ATP synthase membrane subunit b/b'